MLPKKQKLQNYEVRKELEQIDEIALNEPVLREFESVYQQAKKEGIVNKFGRICYERAIENGK